MTAKNILIIMSDEHSADAMGCAGHGIVRTPHLDALAARGTRFTNAYTPSPMCVPARAALATGKYVHATRYWDSATPYDGRLPGWAHELRGRGHETVSIGKLHFRSSEDDNGFTEEILPMHVVGGIGWPVGLLRHDPPPFEAAAELAADVGAGESDYTNYDLAITEAAERWLKTPRDGPWAAFVSFVSPHYPLRAPKRCFDMYAGADMDLPVSAPPDHPELNRVGQFFDYGRYFDDATAREARAAYYGLTSFLDACVGRVMAALKASGQADETLVAYASDHGEMLGDHGFWTKQVMYEASAKVPLIIAGPGVPVGRHVRTAVSLLDVAATALGADGSLVDLALAEDDPERTVLSEYHDGGSSTGTFMVRWDCWKYVHYVGERPQLFDLSADPEELNDLAGDSAALGALAEGERRLRTFCDPEAVNAQAFADQATRTEALGGREAILRAEAFNHTPVPSG